MKFVSSLAYLCAGAIAFFSHNDIDGKLTTPGLQDKVKEVILGCVIDENRNKEEDEGEVNLYGVERFGKNVIIKGFLPVDEYAGNSIDVTIRDVNNNGRAEYIGRKLPERNEFPENVKYFCFVRIPVAFYEEKIRSTGHAHVLKNPIEFSIEVRASGFKDVKRNRSFTVDFNKKQDDVY